MNNFKKLFVLMVPFFTSCNIDVDTPNTKLTQNEIRKTNKYKHPLSNIELIDGKVPGVDIYRSPNGFKYAFGESTTGHENNKVTHTSGIIKLPSSFSDLKSEYPKVRFSQRDQPSSIIRQRLAVKLSYMSKQEVVHVQIRLKSDDEHLFVKEERLIGLGIIIDNVTRISERRKLVQQRQQSVKSKLQPLLSYLDKIGRTYNTRRNIYFVDVKLNASEINEIANNVQDIKSIDLVSNTGFNEQSGSLDLPLSYLDSTVNGAEIIQGIQASQFILPGFDGRNDWTNRLSAAVLESGHARKTHNAFRDSGFDLTHRFSDRVVCGYFSCSYNSSTSYHDQHATNTTAIIAADFHDGQEPLLVNDSDRYIYKGISPESTVFSYALTTSLSFESAVDHLIGRSNRPNIVNMSYGTVSYTNIFHDCYGDWDDDELANDLFENGMLLVKSAGNINSSDQGTQYSSGCRVSIPGSAAGTFTVGLTGSNASNGINEVLNGPLHWRSPRGGASRSSRTIIDMVAPGKKSTPLVSSNNGYNQFEPLLATSYAAPIVTGVALNFIDFYRRTYSNWINNPGALFANLLVMGDRTNASGNGYGFSNRFGPLAGAGRLRARMFNHNGMDVPWRYVRYSLCVDQNETVKFHFGPNAPIGAYALDEIPGDVEHLKAAIYWYDRRLEDHGDSAQIDDIDLKIVGYQNGGYGPYTFASSVSSYDNKEMVHLNFSTGANTLIDKSEGISVEIKGYDVTADNEGCGTNSMRVWAVIYYEDGDRDDLDGPSPRIAQP